MAAITSAVVVAGATYASARTQASAAKKAGNAQAKAAMDANALQQQQYDQTREDNAPWLNAGSTALQYYMAGLGLPTDSVASAVAAPGKFTAADALSGNGYNADLYATDPNYKAAYDEVAQFHNLGAGGSFSRKGMDLNKISSHITEVYNRNAAANPSTAATASKAPTQADVLAAFQSQPGYQFGLDQGTKALQTSASAAGGLYSGKAGKALTEYGQDYANSKYGDYLSKIGSLAGLGQTTASNLGSLGQSNVNAQSQNLNNAGQARASGIIGQANAQSNLYSQIGGIAGYAANRWGG